MSVLSIFLGGRRRGDLRILCRAWYWITSRKRVWSRKTPSTSSKQQGQTMPALEMSSFSSKYSLFRSPWVDIKRRGRRGNSIIYHVWGTVGGAVFTWIAEGMCAWSVNIIFDLLILSHCFYFRMKQRKRALFDRCMIDSARREMIYGVLSLLEIYCLGGWTAANVCITLTGWWKPPKVPPRAMSSIRLNGSSVIDIKWVVLDQQSWVYRQL